MRSAAPTMSTSRNASAKNLDDWGDWGDNKPASNGSKVRCLVVTCSGRLVYSSRPLRPFQLVISLYQRLARFLVATGRLILGPSQTMGTIM